MRIGTYELESPLMNAGGVVKTVEDVRMMAETGVGAVLAGSYTLEPRIGNSPNGETVYYHNPESGATFNALGMPNKGLTETAKDLPEMIDIAHDHGKPFVLNFAPVSHDPVEEVIAMGKVLERAGITGLDAIELNGSCPNVVTSDGNRHALLSHNPELLGDVLGQLKSISRNEAPIDSLIVRISPFLTRASALLLVRQLHDSNVDIVSAFNTFPGGNPVNAKGESILQVPGGIGGQSGTSNVDEAELQTKWLVRARNDIGADFEIIGSNGVTDAQSMKRRLDLGVSAVSSSTLFYEASRWGNAVDKVLSDFSEL